jgi:hypothetical protein
MNKGIARALKTLKNVRGAWIENQEVLLDEKREDIGISSADEGNIYS